MTSTQGSDNQLFETQARQTEQDKNMTEQNTIAISGLQQKANSGDAQAQFDLALRYIKGTDVEKNTALSFDWLNKAAENGHINAQFALALYYFLGVDSKQTQKLADRWAWKSVQGKDVDPALDLAISLAATTVDKGFTKGNENLAYLWFKKAAEKNHPEATYWLGQCDLNGWGTENNDSLAFEYFKKAAEQKVKDAYYDLALCYYQGKGVEQSDVLAFEWLTKAVKTNNPKLSSDDFLEACLLLGKMYQQGKGVEQNDEQAFNWFKKVAEDDKAAENHVAEAQYQLARFYESGKSVEKNIDLAAQYYLSASNKGKADAEALYRLGKYYLYEIGTYQKGYKMGGLLMIDVFQAGHVEAIKKINHICLSLAIPSSLLGKGRDDQYYNFLLEWCTQKIEGNNAPEAYFFLGLLYFSGKGVEQNNQLAFEYFETAYIKLESMRNDENENELIEQLIWFYLSTCYCQGKGVNKDLVKADKFNCFREDVLGSLFIKGIKILYGTPQHLKSFLVVLRIELYKYAKEYDLASAFIKEVFDESNGVDKIFKDICLASIEQEKKLDKKNQELEEKNKQLQEAQQELEDMMSMFAHKFRSPLDTILYNTTHDNEERLYTEAAQTMRGLLDIFSIISTDSAVLKKKIKEDNHGNGRLVSILDKTLDMILLHLLSVSGMEKIQQHYLAYAQAQGLCEHPISYKIWNEDYFELERQLQTDWEQSYAVLISQNASLQQRLAWLEQHFFKLELKGFERDDIQFKEYGVTESFLTILLNEILVNAFKYYASVDKVPVVIEWREREDYLVLSCHNPSARSERSKLKGSGKGHTFLSALARKTDSQFNKPKYQDDFILEFGITKEFLNST